jgi:hypothetical protein
MTYPSDGPFRRRMKDSRRLRAWICRVVFSWINPNGNTAYHKGMTQLIWDVRHQFAFRHLGTQTNRESRSRGLPRTKELSPKQDSMGFPRERVLNNERGSAKQITSATL